jgi:3-oxoacyl-[acyl-carrier protein] reductase
MGEDTIFGKSVAVVTGGSRGIGSAIALALARNGAQVVVNYHLRAQQAQEVASRISAVGGTAIVVQADVASRRQVEQMYEKVVERFGRIDLLVNNAGEIVKPAAWQDITEAGWERSLDVNLRGPFHCIRSAIQYMKGSENASVVNLASTFGPIIGSPAVIAYSSAKAGVVAMTRAFAKALAPQIRVNCVAPGVVDTEMTAGSSEEFVKAQIEATLLKRLGTPEDIADAVVFLLSSKARFITGQVVVVDGGHSLR